MGIQNQTITPYNKMETENLPATETNGDVVPSSPPRNQKTESDTPTSPKPPVKVWVDECGFAMATMKRAVEAQTLPHKFVRELDMTKADVHYMDSETKHFIDTHGKEPSMADNWDGMKAESFGAYCPYACKIDGKKRTAIMFGFANHIFPDFVPEHPKSWLVPEEEDELRKHMTETGALIICKPDQGYCGAGIFIAQTVDDLKFAQDTTYICQIYINNPLTFGDRSRKIDYRVSFVNVDTNGSYGEVYYQTRNQGRIAVDTYTPLSTENKDDVKSHITFYPELFSDPECYKVTKDCENYSEICNFQCWEQVCQYYHTHGHPEFETKVSAAMENLSQKLQQIMRPFYKMCYAAKGIKMAKELNYTFANFFGSDILIDEDYGVHLVEFNVTPSCGDYLDSHDLPGEINPVFQKWGVEALELWLEYARNLYDGVEFGDKMQIGSYKKIYGKGVEAKHTDKGEVLEKLFNMYMLVAIGSPDIPHYDVEKMGDKLKTEAWFPLSIEKERFISAFRTVNTRVSEESLGEFYDKFVTEESGIYLVACAMVKLYTSAECLEMLKRFD